MNDDLNQNFADYVPPGRGPLRYETRRGREEAEARGAEFLEPPSTRNLGAELEGWWAELTPEQRVGEAIGNLWQPELGAMGTLAKGGTRFFSYLTKVLEEASAQGAVKGHKFLPNFVGEQILRRLQKVGVSKDELKYTGVGDWLRERGKKPVDLGELTEFAKANELRMKVRELAFNESVDKNDLLRRMGEAVDKMGIGAELIERGNPKLATALKHGRTRVIDNQTRLEFQQPSHSEGYYQGGYVLPNKLGLPPAGYRERLYEPNKPEGIDVEVYPHRSYQRAFAHSRGEPRDFLVRGKKTIFGNEDVEEVPGLMVEELQSDLHQNVAGYLTGDPLKDAELIVETGAKRLTRVEKITPRDNDYIQHIYDWSDVNPKSDAHIRITRTDKGYKANIYGDKANGEYVDSEEVFRDIRALKEGLPAFVRSEGLDPAPMLENWKGQLFDADSHLATDYPFKKDWWKVQVKDWLKLAAEDPTAKVLGLPSGEMMAKRLGFTPFKKGSEIVYFPEYNKVSIKTPERNYTIGENAVGRVLGPGFLDKLRKDKIVRTEEDIVPPYGQFAWELYEKKVPKWIEEEFGVKVEKGFTETNFGHSHGGAGVEKVPVWIVPVDQIREKLKKPLRLSFLSESQKEFA